MSRWYKANKKERNEHSRKWREANQERRKKYYEDTQEHIKEYRKKHYKANKEAINKYDRDYKKNKRRVDPTFKLIANLRTRHRKVLHGIVSTTKGLGCDSNFFREYVENQWVVGMSWNNYGIREGQWSLDHKLPLTLYYTQPELLPDLIHYTNIQPMWHVENIKKGNKI